MSIFTTDNGKRVIVQRPNMPILIAIATWLISIFASGSLAEVSRVFASIFFILWGVLEMVWGVNQFRKLLGIGALIVSLVILI